MSSFAKFWTVVFTLLTIAAFIIGLVQRNIYIGVPALLVELALVALYNGLFGVIALCDRVRRIRDELGYRRWARKQDALEAGCTTS